jgi:DNA-binding NarL/FixJ family response regulator
LVSVKIQEVFAGSKNSVKNPVKLIRVILADDHTLVRAGIRALLEKLPEVKVIAEAGDGREVLSLVTLHQPEVVLMDIAMPGLNGLEATERMARDFPNVRIIILSMHNNEEYVLRALKAGAAGYLLKKAATSELETALHKVLRREIYLSQEIATQLHKRFPLHGITDQKSPLEKLTGRQREILQLIAEGQNTKGIGKILNVSPKTVEYHRMKLMHCLNVHDIAGLVRFALRVGLISEEKLAIGPL